VPLHHGTPNLSTSHINSSEFQDKHAMLLSMTGHGEGTFQFEGERAQVEIRTVNNRYFKFILRANTDNIGALESRTEPVVREIIRRGTVSVTLKVERQARADQFRINATVLRGYVAQLEEIFPNGDPRAQVSLNALLALPGVAEEASGMADSSERDWQLFEPALRAALENLESMRRREGSAMHEELSTNLSDIAKQLLAIERRAPVVVENYRSRLTERIGLLLKDHEITLSSSDVVREVGLFADRCDISEETVRLRSHMDQFREVMESSQSGGRKLDFLIQEMFRETNTIGSKANDAEIARHVVEIKTNIERMREMVQNVE
jgi:uncharacterized protein (TIGR00255 family)